MGSPTDTLNKLYTKTIMKSSKYKATDIEEKEKRDFDSGSSPFIKPNTMDMSMKGSTTNDISKDEPYNTNRDIGDLPAGGGGHNAAPLPDKTSSEPFDYSAPSGEDKDEKKRKIMRTSDGEEIEVREQGEDMLDPSAEQQPEQTGDDMALPADPATTDPSMNAEQPGGEDMGMGGMGMGGAEEEEKSPHDLGRIYELKKIYARLTSIESYLSSEADPELTEIRKYVSQSIELFEIVASNIDSYKEKMDDIIISYYKFLKEIYYKIRDYYKDKSSEKGV